MWSTFNSCVLFIEVSESVLLNYAKKPVTELLTTSSTTLVPAEKKKLQVLHKTNCRGIYCRAGKLCCKKFPRFSWTHYNFPNSRLLDLLINVVATHESVVTVLLHVVVGAKILCTKCFYSLCPQTLKHKHFSKDGLRIAKQALHVRKQTSKGIRTGVIILILIGPLWVPVSCCSASKVLEWLNAN